MSTMTPEEILAHKYSVPLRSEHSKTKFVGWHKVEMSEEAKEWLENIDESDYLVIQRSDDTPLVMFKDEIRATQFKLAFG